MWTVVYVASTWSEAERIKDILAKHGLLIMLRACRHPKGKGSQHVELLVPEIEVDDAHSVIMDVVGTVRAF